MSGQCSYLVIAFFLSWITGRQQYKKTRISHKTRQEKSRMASPVRKTTNYKVAENCNLLDLVDRRVEPLGSEDWESICIVYNVWANSLAFCERTPDGLKTKFDRLCASKKPLVIRLALLM